MDLTKIFYTDNTLTSEEQDWIIEIFSHPTMTKYLTMMGRNDLAELATLATSSIEDGELGKKHSLVQGKLSTLVTLLQLSKLKESKS